MQCKHNPPVAKERPPLFLAAQNHMPQRRIAPSGTAPRRTIFRWNLLPAPFRTVFMAPFRAVFMTPLRAIFMAPLRAHAVAVHSAAMNIRVMGPMVMAALFFFAMAMSASSPALAQDGGDSPGGNGGDPARDIFIEGLGFSKLILRLELTEALKDFRANLRTQPRVEKNLCWSGVFNLTGNFSRYCRLQGEPNRIDMRLALSLEDGKEVFRLYDTGPEGLLLFEEAMSLEPAEGSKPGTPIPEVRIMDLVNRMTERITGKVGLLGSSIAFTLRQPGYAKVIVSTDTHGRQLKLLSHNRDINILPRFTRQGTGMVYTVLGRRGSAVYYQDLGGGNSHAVPSHFLTKPGSLNTGGAFSPDGLQVVVTMSINQNADLFLFDLLKKRHMQITSRTGIETQANWSPDGQQIVFVSDRSGTPQIYLMDFDDREDIRLTFNGTYNADPKWSPDGKSLLFTKRVNGIEQIHIMDQYGENVRMVTRGRYYSEQAEWAPDGRQIVFASNRTGEFKLYVVSTDGSNLRRLTHTPKGFEENSPTWTSRRLLR